MKRPTKVALENIATKMVDEGIYINTRGSVNFMSEAVKIHKSFDSMVSPQTIKIHEKDLEQMCQDLLKSKQPKVELRPEWQRLYDSEAIELTDEEAIELLPDDVILRKAEEIKQLAQLLQPKPKDYNMFDQSVDILWKYGNLARKAVGTPGLGYYNSANIWTSERTHARYMLSQVPNSFTEDDIELLEKIAAGKV
jgi:hypothetical protein